MAQFIENTVNELVKQQVRKKHMHFLRKRGTGETKPSAIGADEINPRDTFHFGLRDQFWNNLRSQ